MKKVLSLLLFLVITASLVACGGGGNKENNAGEKIDVAEVFTQITDEVSADRDGEMGGLIELDLVGDNEEPFAEMMVEELGFSDELVREGYMLASAMNINSDAIILIEAMDADKVAEVEEKLEAYHEAQNSMWETYLPDQHAKVQNTIIESKGAYIIYITYEEPEKIKDIFTNAF